MSTLSARHTPPARHRGEDGPILDLDRPLGQSRKSRTSRPRRRWKAPTAIALLTLAAVAGSLAVTLRAPEIQRIAALPATPSLPQSDPVKTAMEGRQNPQPNIIRMNADGGVSIVETSPFTTDAAYTGSIRVSEPGSLRQPPRMAHIPDPALLESSTFGELPTRAPDGRRPLDVYAGQASGSAGTRIALIVGGLGISQTGTQAAIANLPQAVTLAFAASGNSLDRWMQEARRSGHELLLQVPLEPFGYPGVSPGPGMLSATDASAGQLDALRRAMARMTNYVGVMNFMGARLSSEPSAIEQVLAEVGRRGLLYVDDGSSARSLAGDVAMASRIPFARGERMLDQQRDPAAIRAELDILERSARAQGTAIGVASAFDASISTIAQWAREAEARGVELVPISNLAFDPEAR